MVLTARTDVTELSAELTGLGVGPVEVVDRGSLAAVVDSPQSGIDADTDFMDVGFSSLSALELYRRLHAATGLPLPPTVAYDHPTPAALGPFLRTELMDGVR